MSRRRSNISASLRRRRALRVAVGVHRFEWRALDAKVGRPAVTFPRVVDSESDCLRLMHEWLLANRLHAESWWFHVRELAYDYSGRYHVCVRYFDVLVYRRTLFDDIRSDFIVQNRKEACFA